MGQTDITVRHGMLKSRREKRPFQAPAANKHGLAVPVARSELILS